MYNYDIIDNLCRLLVQPPVIQFAMTSVRHSRSFSIRIPLPVRAAVLAVLAWVGSPPHAHAQMIVHEFFVPMPEAQIRSALVSIEPASGIVGQTMESVVSVVVTGNGTAITYDHWEDGYEVDLDHPTQSTTQIWGDGNNANGIPPGFANDPASLSSGAVISMRNQISLPRNPSVLLYDGRDRVGGTKALVMTRTGWAVTPGTVLAGSVEVPATLDYGTQFFSPVGQDISASSMFEYVGLFVQAKDDGTTVTIDTDGSGPTVAFNVTLNRGESHLVNGGIKKGATATASKPVQAQLVTGDIGARYETDWMTLFPAEQWSSTYYSPVGTAADGDATFAFLYNDNASSITIDYYTGVGSGSFSVPAKGVYQHQLPQSYGTRFSSSGGEPFFGVVMVGANPSANNVHDWGFTLVPADSLTTEAVCGWGPGSSDLSQNGSPVWVTPIAPARVYVDLNGDRNGPLTDPNGNKYDAHYDLGGLEIRTLLDPDKDQTAMRLYTLDGTQITAAWGQDPAIAGPGNPFLDVGTTVLPFPVPVLKKSSVIHTDNAPTGLSVGDVLEYTVQVDNRGLLPLGNLIVLDPLTPSLSYVPNSTSRDGTAIADSPSGTAFPLDESGYLIPIILRSGNTVFKYRATIVAAGSIYNSVSNASYNLVSDNEVEVPPPGGSTAGVIEFTDAGGTSQTTYLAGTSIYVKLTDADADNDDAAVETVQVVVKDTTDGDLQTITLTETGVNTGIFFSTAALPSSTTAGLAQQDGTLYVSPGDNLYVDYTDPEFGDTVSDTATVVAPAMIKPLYLSTDGSGSPDQDLDRIDPVAAADGTTAQTGILELTSSTVTIDATSSAQTTGTSSSSLTFSHTVGSGSNRLMLVAVAVGGTGTGGGAGTVSSVTYGGTALTQVGTRSSGTEVRTYIYRLIAPPVGTANVAVSVSVNSTIAAGATSFFGVDQTTPLGTYASNAGLGTSASVSVASATGEMVYGSAGWDSSPTISLPGGSGQTLAWNRTVTNPSNTLAGAASTEAGAASVTHSYSSNESQEWAVGGVSIKPAPATGSATVTFTQTPSFFQDFSLPAGGPLSVINYVSIVSGSMPANPNINAVLKYGSTTLATLTGPVYDGGAGTLTWTGAIGSAATVPSGQAIALEVTTAEAGVTFRIDYDSATKPSKISLPATTVIDVNSLAVYDAPYPGGNVVNSTANGATLYVRATVSDPFGAYDITSLDLNIDGPGGAGDITTTLSGPNEVATGGALKTYEYVWTTGSTTGTYNIAVTAHEGTEGIIDTRATEVTLSFLDTGTPSITEFTTGLDGPGTPTYAGNETVCVRVTDVDQNLSSSTIETITAVISSTTGADSETVTLTETGPDTGVFVSSIPASTSGGGGANDGTLRAPVGDVLHVNYVDPTDPTDTSSDIATVPPPPGTPAVSVNKVLVAPADGLAVVGEAVQFAIQVTNSGSTTLSSVSLTDTFPAANLAFVSASVTPDSVGAGTLSWTNVGPLTEGQSVTIYVNFTATASAVPATNSALADAGGGVTSNDDASVTITNPAHTVTKTLLSPNPGPADIGDDVVFRIQVQNTGDTAIATLPLEDAYSGANFDYVSATLAPGATGSGSLLWTDITGAGNLAPGNSITIDVTLRAKGAANPAANTAAAEYSTDVNGDPLPPSTSTSTIVLLAAKITGTVYNDADESGGFSAGDTGLSPVTVQLYTDPNGDGNPADGVLVAITATDAAGAYEFLNLGLGDYVVVESDPSGYTSSGDTGGTNDNRVPVEVTSLTTYAGNHFFDYLPDPNDYATISGTVWDDADASGTVNGGESGIENVTVELVQDLNNNGSADAGEPVTASTVTAADGTYSFAMIPPGEYVIRETDRFGYASTADTDAPNDNQIEITATAGAASSGNDFLDVLTGTVTGIVYYDANFNGAYDAGTDSPLADVDVLITDSLGGTQTVTTDANGTWTATVPPGNTTANLDETDPDFAAAFANPPVQTEGADPNTVTAVSSSNVSAGNDGFMDPGIITGTVLADTDNDDAGDAPLPGVVLTLLDSGGNVIDGDPGTPGVQPITATTNAGGVYIFNGLTPGTYQIGEAQPSGYQSIGDRDGGDLDVIGDVVPRDIDPGETDSGNNFVEEEFGSITGTVLADTDNDDIGDTGIAGVVLTLLDSSGAPIDGDSGTPGVQPITVTTNGGGVYAFGEVEPGDYRVGEAQPVGYQSVSDSDGGNLDQAGDVTLISVVAGMSSSDNDFVEEQLGAISGTVLADSDNDDVGDAAMPGVSMALFTDPNGDGDPVDGAQVGPAVQTDAGGSYTFSDIEPGNYVVVQTQPAGYLTVRDGDSTTPGDDAANASASDNRIPAGIAAGETDDGNDFTEEQPGVIAGEVLADTDNDDVGDTPLTGVVLTLLDAGGGVIDGDPGTPGVQPITVSTNGSGVFTFNDVAPGNYRIGEAQPSGYLSVSDSDGGNPDQIGDVALVSVSGGGTAAGNDFVEEQAAAIGNLVWIDSDNDGIKDAGEPGLDGVMVELLDGGGNPIDSDSGTPGVQPTTATTGGGGGYSFADLPPGSYQLRIAAPPPSHPISSTATDTSDNGEDGDDNGSQTVAGGAITGPVVALAAGENDVSLDFGLVAAATLGNSVWHDANNDGVKDGGESGIDGVLVALFDSLGNAVDDPAQTGVQAYTVTTSGGGVYSFTNLVPGSYEVRIPTAPAAYPLSSVATDTGDNGEDDDDNGSQSTPTALTTSPLVTLAHGETDNTVDFGFAALGGSYSISGQVRDDFDLDGNFSDADQPVPGVTVRLYADSNGNGSYDSGTDVLLDTTTTNGFGIYNFTGLPDGAYFAEEVDPRPSSSTADTQGANDNLIALVIAGGDSNGNDFLDAVDPAGYIYDVVTGQIIGGGSIGVSGPGAVTILLDGSTGQYSFITDGTPGSYTISYTPPTGYLIDPARPVAGPSLDPTGGPDPTVLGSGENPANPGYLTDATASSNPYYLTFVLEPGDPFVINNNIPLRLAKPKTFDYWKKVIPGGGPTPGSNGDGDCYTDLIEYALDLDPNTGVQTTPAFRGIHNTVTGKVDALFNRVSGGLNDVTYTLTGITDLGASPGGWTALTVVPTITDNGDGTETVTFADLESDPFFNGQDHGMVRLSIALDENGDTVPEMTASTPAFGWTRRTFQAECVMTGHPYLRDKLFCGAVDSVGGSTLDVTTSAGGQSIVAQFIAGRKYFIEVYSGDNAGQRFEIDEGACTASSIVLDAASDLNTQTAIPASLAGDKVVIREHWTLDGLFNPAQFGSTNNASTGDRLLFYNRNTGAFDIYWLFNNGGSPRWVLLGDATLADQGGRIMEPCEGWFTHPKNGPREVVWHGMIRANPFACPLKAGPNFIGSGWPMDQSPAMRGMTTAAGFIGTRDPATADQILFWKGDTGLQSLAYYSHFLLNHGALQQWTEVGNAALVNENNDLMFHPTTGCIMRMRAGLPGFVMPMPWTP